MNNQFDELAKGMAQSVTRRQALKNFSAGLVGMALASFGFTSIAHPGNGKGGGPKKNRCLETGVACDPSANRCCSGLCICADPNGGCEGGLGPHICG